MEVLPLRFIMHEDAAIVGKELTDLASIKRLGFPIPDGLILFPPQIPFKSILQAYLAHDTQRFEQSLEIIRSQVFKIELPESLKHELKQHKLDSKIVWRDALQSWLTQIRSKVWREGVSDKLVQNLSPIPVFFTEKHLSSGDAFFDPEEKSIKIRVNEGNLDPNIQTELQQLLQKMRQKILTNYLVSWIVDQKKGLQIVRVVEFTHTVTDQNFVQEIEVKEYVHEQKDKPKLKTRLKLFADLSDGYVLEEDLDGIFLASEKIETDDRKILKLVESGMATDEYVIFQLTNHKSKDDVSSALRLIHQPELVQKELHTFLFAKHNYAKQKKSSEHLVKQPLLHLQLAIPKIVSLNELQELKKLMKKNGIERRGSTKLWVEMSVPENWIHLNNYLAEGIDGIIVNLDDLYGALIGVEDFVHHPFYQFEPEVVLNFIERFLKNLKTLPILFKAERILDDEIVKFSIKHGIFGLILNRIQYGGAREYVYQFEKKYLLQKSSHLQ